MTIATADWPSREEWAQQRRTLHYDQLPVLSDRIADYATPDEIVSISIALRERWKALGVEMKSIGAPPMGDLGLRRRSVNRALKLIRHGQLPIVPENYQGAEDILASFHSRYEAAKRQAYEMREREMAQTPIDDAAWATELERRARIDGRLAQSGQRNTDR